MVGPEDRTRDRSTGTDLGLRSRERDKRSRLKCLELRKLSAAQQKPRTPGPNPQHAQASNNGWLLHIQGSTWPLKQLASEAQEPEAAHHPTPWSPAGGP